MLDFSQDLSAQTPLVHPTSRIQNCTLGRYVEIGDHCVLEETAVGDYTYCFGSNDVIYTTLGKFNSIATGVRISPVQHPGQDPGGRASFYLSLFPLRVWTGRRGPDPVAAGDVPCDHRQRCLDRS